MHPDKTEYAAYYSGYVSLAAEDDIVTALEEQATETQKMLSALDDARASYRYAEGKWSIKELVGHVTDAERIFATRALSFSRGESQPLPGFDENAYVSRAAFDNWRFSDLVESYALLRRATVLLFRNLPEEAWTRRGTASGAEVSVRALAHIILGHERHHLNVLRERYGL